VLQSFDDSQQMLMSAALLQRGDVVMAFSYSGQTAVVVVVARQARQSVARLIALTNQSDSLLSREIGRDALCQPTKVRHGRGKMRRRAWRSSAFSTRS
jgi:uncharacterized phosphosugar-binding protein